MRKACGVCANILTYFSSIIKPGMTTLELDRIAEDRIRAAGCTPAFKGYRGFPFTICTSVNDEVVHCKPSERPLKDGDILTVDIGAVYEGFYSDTAKTFTVGQVSDKTNELIKVGYESLLEGVKKAVDGNFVEDISNAVYQYATSKGFGVVDEYVGHGIGTELHEDPRISNTPTKRQTPQLSNGMVICIEPILTIDKSGAVKNLSQWEVKTVDGSVAVHWEHTIAILPSGPEILTLRDEER